MVYLTEQQCCKIAIDIQDACNVGGVSHTYHEVLISLRDIKGWDNQRELGKHPAVILIRDKLDDLIGIPIKDRFDVRYGIYRECKEMAQEAMNNE